MSEISHALNRFGYGIRNGERPPVDPKAYLLRQLAEFDPRPGPLAQRPDTSGEAGELLQIIRRSRRAAQQEPSAMDDEPGQSRGRDKRAERLEGLPPEYRDKAREAFGRYRKDAAARLRIAVASPTPFAERLVHFWANHFSVSSGKAGTAYEVGNHEFTAIRPRIGGRFSDLLKAAALSPAMLLYLDQFQSIGPNSTYGSRQRRRAQGNRPQRGLNENLAREILELHTVGVDGGYTQDDVTEFARALTGWTIPGLARIARFAEEKPGGAAFVGVAHEPGTRRVLGKAYPDTGADQAIAILDDLATHPATARFVATKLARHFTADHPPQALVTRLERNFLETGGDLASLYRTLVNAPESWAGEPAKFRQPFEWFTTVLRLAGVSELGDSRINGALRQLGQVPWSAPSPAGFDDIADSWAGPEALLRRIEVAERIARNVPADDVLARAETAFPDALSDSTRTWLARAESGAQAMGLLLVAPEMMRR
ncbi:MAG: DUF1800 domain-containing protein [Pseudomonadota bacterium]